MVFKIFLILFSIYAIHRAKKQYEKRQASRYWAVVWSFMWLVVIIVALMPQATDAVAKFVGVGRGADLLVYLAVIFLLFATYRMMVREQKMSEDITELVRKIAVDRPERS